MKKMFKDSFEKCCLFFGHFSFWIKNKGCLIIMTKFLNFIFAQVLGKHHVFANTKIMWKGVVLKVRIKYGNT